MFYATQMKLHTLHLEVLKEANSVVNDKLYPLRGYMHLEHSKRLEFQPTLETRFIKQFSSINTMLALWRLRSRANRAQKEIEQQEERTKRLNIKWNSWNTLTKKRKRLQYKIKQLQM